MPNSIIHPTRHKGIGPDNRYFWRVMMGVGLIFEAMAPESQSSYLRMNSAGASNVLNCVCRIINDSSHERAEQIRDRK